ncbi:MAG: AraC family transcriptional regulator [Clostridiales bacterium]|jgi:AraC-like DNA-binding protein|nr:AraC family transcriptional regulator [Clostridiales bacterium]
MKNSKSVLKDKVYFKFILDNFDSGFFPLVVGHEICSSDKEKWSPLIKNHFFIHFVLNGRGFFTIDKKSYAISGGDLFLITPNTVCSWEPDRADPWEYIWIEFNGANAKFLCETIGLKRETPAYTVKNFEPVRTELIKMINASLSPRLLSVRVTAHIYLIMAMLSEERFPYECARSRSRGELNMRGVIDYIEKNYANPATTLDTIGKYFHFNSSYLSRAFKKFTGITLKKYITNFRMQKACELLEHDDCNVTIAAFSVGYSDSLYFSRLFKSLFHVAPSRYTSSNYKSQN